MKPLLKRAPGICRHAVTAGYPDAMIQIVRYPRSVKQIAAELPDILKHRAIPTDHIIPKLVDRKRLANHNTGSACQRGAGNEYTSNAVIHRQAIVNSVIRLNMEHSSKPLGPLQNTRVTDISSLRQAGCARRIDVERNIIDGKPWPLCIRQIAGRQLLNVMIDTRERSAATSVNPDLLFTRKPRHR